MSHAGMLLAAPASGSGKTTITCALLAALKKRNIRVRSFKSGPDYIDPMYHEQVIGVPSENLDTFFSGEEQIRCLYERQKEQFDCTVIEGAMGLYDGLGGTRPEGSAYHLAQTLQLPVFLVLDAKGMGRTMLALLAGMLQYDRDHRIAGVILNRTTEHFCEIIRPQIEEELGLPVMGFFPERKKLHLESRHLGLQMPGEIQALKEQVSFAAEILEQSVDVDRMLELAERSALLISYRRGASKETNPGQGQLPDVRTEAFGKVKKRPRIAVARDEAFCFYYKENLRLLEEAGAQLIEFSPLRDSRLPEHTEGILLGGGYPELFAKELSENGSMRKSIKDAIAAGVPSVAECGGFMYLHETLTDDKGNTHPMAGVIPGGCRNTGRLVRFGYVEIEEKKSLFLEGKSIRGHEFHYYDSDHNGQCCTAAKPTTGRTWECVHASENHWWGYPHLYYPSNPAFVSYFLGRCMEAGEKTD